MSMEEHINILLVDDRPDNLAVLETILDDPHYNLVKAYSGQEALKRLLKHDFAVILLDVQMPHMDGFETAELIRARDRSKHTPIIFVTAIDRSETHVFKGYAIGAVDYLFKPILPEILRSKVAVFVDLFRKTREIERQAQALSITNQRLEREITERKRFEQELWEKNIELDRISQAKTKFLAGTSHELRTPLNAIIGLIGILLMKMPGPLTADQEKHLKTVQTSARHLLSLINDLLDLAKIESGKMDLTFEPVVCQDLVEEVAATLRPLAEAKELQLRVDAPDQPIVLATDRRALKQIMINLGNNAIKFTERGAITIALMHGAQAVDGDFNEGEERLHAIARPGEIAFSVIDTGPGIKPDDQSRLFQAFARVGAVEVRKQEGSGLGLHICQILASMLGGRIDLRSAQGEGSAFTLALPEKA